MDDAIASIFIEAVLDTSGWVDDIKSASDRINKLPAISPKVDQTQLHDLNKTLDIKSKHLKQTVDYFANNPIRPTIDTSNLDRDLNRRINIETEVRLKDLNLNTARQSITGVLSKPFDIALNIPKNILRGSLEGIGRSLSTVIGSTLEKGINKKFESGIGSLKLFGNKIGESITDGLERSLDNYLNTSKSKFAKKVRGLSISNELLNAFVGDEDVAIELNAKRAKLQQTKEKKRELARTGVLPAYREEKVNVDRAAKRYKESKINFDYYTPRIEESLNTTTSKLDRLSNITRTSTNSEKINKLYKKLSTKLIVLRNNQTNLYTEKEAAFNELSNANNALGQLDLEIASLTNKKLPKWYQDRLDVVAPKIKRSQIPKLVEGAVRKGQAGVYNSRLNRIGVRSDIVSRFESGTQTSVDISLLDEEIRHAVDADFGTLEGMENVISGRVKPDKRVKIKKSDRPLIQIVNRELEAYPEYIRDVEFNAKLVSQRNAAEFKNKKKTGILSDIAGRDGKNINRQKELLTGMADLMNEGAIPDFKIRLFRKKIDETYQELPKILDQVIDAQTIGLSDEKINPLIEKVAKLKNKGDRLKEKAFKTIKGESTKFKRYDPKDITDVDIWDDNILSRPRNRNSYKRPAKLQDEPQEAILGELILSNKEKIEMLLDNMPFDLGNKAKSGLKNIAGRVGTGLGNTAKSGLKNIAGSVGTGLGGAARVYGALKGTENALFSIAPWAAVPAKAMIQGVGTYALLGKIPGAQALLGGGAESLLAGGASAASDLMGGGLAGGVVESIGTTLAPLIAPALAGKTVANIAIKSIESALPNDVKKVTRRLRQQEKELKRLQSEFTKDIPLLEVAGGITSIDTVRAIKESITKGYKTLNEALTAGNQKEVKRLAESLDIDSEKASNAVKTYYQQLPKDSPERKEAGAFNRFLGAKRRKFKTSLKKIELIPEENDPAELSSLIPEENDPAELSSLKSDFNNYVGKVRKKRNERLINKARLRAAKVDGDFFGIESNEILRESEKDVNKAEKVSQGVGVKAKSFKEAESSINKKLKDFDDLLEPPNLDPIDISKSSVKFASIIGVVGVAVLAATTAIAGIQKSIERTSATLALANNSSSPDDFNKSLSSAKSLSDKLGLNYTDQIRTAATFKASLQGTGLEGISDQLGGGITTYGRLQGANTDQIKRGKIALSQIASKPNLSAEELNQLSESIPGFGQLLASSSGYSQGQLRRLSAKGKIQSSPILANLSPALQAQTAAKEGQLSQNPEVTFGRLSNSVDNLQIKLGGGLLTAILPAAEAANNAIKFLTENLQLLGIAGVVAVGRFIATSISLAMAAQGVTTAIGGIKLAMTGLTAFSAPLLAIAAITAIIDASLSLFNLYNGNNSPTDQLIKGYTNAADAAAKASGEIKNLNAGVNDVELEGWVENTTQFFDKIRNFSLEKLGLPKLRDTKESKAIERREASGRGLEELKKGLIKPERTIDNKGIAILAKEIESVQFESKIANPDESDEVTKTRSKKIERLIKAKDEKSLTLQSTKIEYEEAIKLAEQIISDKTSTDAIKQQAIKDLIIYKNRLNRLDAAASFASNELIAETDAVTNTISKFSGLGLALDRLGAEEASKELNILSGTLYTGTRATIEYTTASKQLYRQIELAKSKSTDAINIINNGDIAAKISRLQEAGKLPKDLRNTSPEQLANLKTIGAPEQIITAIKLYNDSQTEIRDKTAALNKLNDDRVVALRNEEKALSENYRQTIINSKKLEQDIKESTRQLLASYSSAALANKITTLSGAVGEYIDGTINIFNKLQEITTNKAQANQKIQEQVLNKFQAATDKKAAEQQYSGTSVAVATATVNTGNVFAPVAGGRAANSDSKLGVQKYGAARPGSKYGRHLGEDYTGKLGEDVRAVVGGQITEVSRNIAWGKGNVSPLAISIKSTDAEGKELITRYFHIGEKAGKALQVGMMVQGGDVIATIAKDGKVGGNEYHVDIKTKVNGKYEDPSIVFDKLAKKTTQQTLTTPTTPTTPTTQSSDSFTTTNASVYRPNSGKAIDGGTKDMIGNTISDNSMIIATRLNNTKKGLPYNSIVRLRNPKTGKTVDVRAVDTGRFGRGRGIDMTPAVARALGMTPDGVQPIQASVVNAPGRDNQQTFPLGDGELNQPFDNDGVILKRIGSKQQLTINPQQKQQNITPPSYINETYKIKADDADKQIKAIKEQTNISTLTSQLQAQTMEFERYKKTQSALRKEAGEVRTKKQEQRLKNMSFGNSSSSKETQTNKVENQFFVDETIIKIKELEEDFKDEQKEFSRTEKVIDQLSKQTDLNDDQKKLISDFNKDKAKLKKLQNELFKNTKAGLEQDIRLGKKTKLELERKQKIKTRQENNEKASGSIQGGLNLDESLAVKAEEYLKANPFDYKYGDPLTIRKRINLNKQKLDNDLALAKLQDDINALDPTAGNYKKQKKLLEETKAKLIKENKFKVQNIYSNYDNAARQQQLDKAAYISNISRESIGRTNTSLSLQADYQAARGETMGAADSKYRLDAALRKQKLEEDINNLNIAAKKDPRLKTGLGGAIEELKYQKQLNDFIAERNRYTERDIKLRELTKQANDANLEVLGLEQDMLIKSGNNYDARTLAKQTALEKLSKEYDDKKYELSKLQIANEGDKDSPFYNEIKEQLSAIEKSLDTINGKKLEALTTEFSRFQTVITSITTEGERLINDMFSGKGIDSNSLNQFLAAPFKAITDQLSSFLSGQWSNFVNEMMGSLTKDLDNLLGQAGSASSPSGGNIFSTIFKGIGSLFGLGGGSVDSGLGQSLGLIPTFSDGGLIDPKEKNLRSAVNKAMVKEQRLSGEEPVLLVANKKEMILSKYQTQDYLINNYSDGGALGKVNLPSNNIVKFKSEDIKIEPLKLETTVINNVEYVSADYLKSQLENTQKQQVKQLEQYNIYQTDKIINNLNYRRSLGLN